MLTVCQVWVQHSVDGPTFGLHSGSPSKAANPLSYLSSLDIICYFTAVVCLYRMVDEQASSPLVFDVWLADALPQRQDVVRVQNRKGARVELSKSRRGPFETCDMAL